MSDTTPNSGFNILVVRDRKGSHAYKLGQPLYLLGRSDQADILLTCNTVSRYQATLMENVEPEGTRQYYLVDGNAKTGKPSTNGTYVNNERIDRYLLKNRDRVVFGTSVIGQFFCFASAEESNPDFALECRLDRTLKQWAEQQGIAIDSEAPLSIPVPENPGEAAGDDRFANVKKQVTAKNISDAKLKFPNPSRYGKLGQFFLRKALISQQQLEEVLKSQSHEQKQVGQLLLAQGLISPQELKEALENQAIKLGQVLIKQHRITPAQLNYALEQQKLTRKRLGEILVLMGLISNDDLEHALQEQFWRRSGFWFLK